MSVQSNGPLSPLPLDEDLRSLEPHERVRPGDGAGAGALAAWGGPLGRHAVVGRQRFWTPLRVIMLFAVIFLAFGFFSKAACLETTHPTDGSQPGLNWDGRQYYKACYADPLPLYSAEGLDTGALPYKYSWITDTGEVRYMEYPVLSGMFQYVTAQAARALHEIFPGGPLEVITYFALGCVLLAFMWMVAVWATYRSAGRRPWDTLLMAASPLIIFQAFTNYDLMAVMFASVALLLWARRRPVWAGVVLGLGVAAKLYPLFLFGALLVVAIRRRRFVELGKAAAAAVVAWTAVNLPIMALFPEGWREFFRLNSDRPANPESIYVVIQTLTGWQGFDAGRAAGEAPATLNTVSLVLFAVACLVVLVIGLTAPVTPRVAQLAFLVVAFFLLTNKVWSPQYSLWLVPLAVLAVPRVRLLLTWMAFDALLWVAHMSYFHGVANKGIGPELFHPLVLVRDLLVLAVCAVVITEIYRPHLDRVRMTHQGSPEGPDPLAGVLADPGERLVARPTGAVRPAGATRSTMAAGAARHGGPSSPGSPGSPAAPLAFRAAPSDTGGALPTDPETKDPIR
ncbi:glycosyltransferase family 87 protein [Dietzia cinnamea]|uniref:glycosyltransferase family 87 protein n=1 Tax=Dietzia cinnamea TaxID=321318 RepID=UPI0021A57CC3|nr:glycosyltransferase 87 family protein [Dietzia cinnamea]MCT2273083.1 glycosyltransferase 87 family protein [Dietzia cinnamea]